MRLMRASSLAAAFGFAIILLAPGQAHAYLDPGTGSMLLQGLIAGLAAVSVACGYYWGRIKSFFARTRPRPDREHASDDLGK
jgi:hypothetical protein